MATLGDLKARIIQETVRDDLADDLATGLTTVIQKAIEFHEKERWWFNELVTTLACVPGNQYVAIPATMLWADQLRLQVGGVRYRMTVRTPDHIAGLYSVPMIGQPTDYAVLGAQFWLWPQPNQAYPILAELVTQVQPPLDFTSDASANEWTNSGQDLICAEAKLRLYRDYLSATATDPRIQNAQGQLADAYSGLKRETNRRITTGRVAAGW